MTWYPDDTWIVLIGALCAVACALPGCFLVLRRMSMMGDAISHAVLPGLALAYLITESRASFIMFIGAGVVGLLTALFTHWLNSFGKVDRGAAMGITFTTLFALGLLIIVRAADHVDLDADCVLYGAIEWTPFDTMSLWGWEIPRAAVVLAAVCLGNALVIALLFKEFTISAFDSDLATTQGINATAMHYLLMAMVAITTVAAFEVVGSIIVIAMLIVPAATAYLLTDRLAIMLPLSALFGVLAAGLGHLGAIVVPGWLGFASTSTAGMMASLSGLLFLMVWIVAPSYGLISRWRRMRLPDEAATDIMG